MPKILIAVVLGAHGVKGGLRIHSLASDVRDLVNYGILRDNFGTEYHISSGRHLKGDIVTLSFAEVLDRDKAESLKGLELFIDRDCLRSDNDGFYYHIDLIGLSVCAESGARLGEIIAVRNYGAGDLLEVRRLDGSEVLLIFSEVNVLSVDISACIVLSSLGVEALDVGC